MTVTRPVKQNNCGVPWSHHLKDLRTTRKMRSRPKPGEKKSKEKGKQLKFLAFIPRPDDLVSCQAKPKWLGKLLLLLSLFCTSLAQNLTSRWWQLQVPTATGDDHTGLWPWPSPWPTLLQWFCIWAICSFAFKKFCPCRWMQLLLSSTGTAADTGEGGLQGEDAGSCQSSQQKRRQL